MKISYKKLSDTAKTPLKANPEDAGYDLFADEDCMIFPMERRLVKTSIALSIPKGYYGRVAPRSGLALKAGIDVLAGVIDSTYRGELGVVLMNLNKPNPIQEHNEKMPLYQLVPVSDSYPIVFRIKKGDRIAQLIVEKCYSPEWTEVADLSETARGEGGFGSTDKE